MKKLISLTLALCLVAILPAKAQDPVFEQNDNVINLGVGFGGTLYSGRSLAVWSGYNRLPTLELAYERCIIGELFNEHSAIGVGGIIAYNYSSYRSSWTSTDVLVGARGAFHYTFVDKLDTYAGFMAGYNINTWKWKEPGATTHIGSSGFTYGLFAGARYYFAGPLAAFAELGYGYTFFNAGISLKF